MLTQGCWLRSDYLERLMLTKAKVWSCEISGKHKLTYEEALAVRPGA